MRVYFCLISLYYEAMDKPLPKHLKGLTASEKRAAKRLIKDGWTLLRGGWPDLLAIRRNKEIRLGYDIMAFEIKHDLKQKPKQIQRDVIDVLRIAGLRVAVIDPRLGTVQLNSPEQL